ncbi:MAG: S8 family serine peptidase [Vicinamibacteria bacterium]|nr:S8 family serine peptidase [Vicinamibacteria bacterium]
MGSLTRRAIGIIATLLLLTLLSWPALAAGRPPSRLDATLASRAGGPGISRVIVRSTGVGDVTAKIRAHRGHAGQRLALVDGYVAEVPNDALEALAADPGVAGVHLDRPVGALLAPGGGNDTGNAQGASSSEGDFTGAGVGVAVIDSGLTAWHDDLARVDARRALVGQRVVGFADFTSTTNQVADSYGHGTHVAGIVAGSGHDSEGEYAGVAQGAHLLVLKVLDGEGRGYVSDVIRAIGFAVASRAQFNLRVINLSIGAPVLESYESDPLTLAARRAVEAGMVVVAAAGNFGKNLDDQIQYGGITAPGNAPWVLTVGAYSHMGTPDPSDDRVAGYSSRGPTAFDFVAKPDLVAPGTRIVSLNDAGSALALRNPADLVPGTSGGGYPYLTLSGTSMAAPVVSGVVARMLQANPALTPNAVKAILQYTARVTPDVDFLSQGAGFLNTDAAVSLARFYASSGTGDSYTLGGDWARHILWGNRRVSGGVLQPWGSAWGTNIIWGSGGDNIIWGSAGDNIIWGSSGENIIWGSSGDDNIIWGSGGDNIIWGSGEDNIIWGSGGDNIIWGSSIVWGNRLAREFGGLALALGAGRAAGR